MIRFERTTDLLGELIKVFKGIDRIGTIRRDAVELGGWTYEPMDNRFCLSGYTRVGMCRIVKQHYKDK